jgi:hypothetical protein
MNNLITYTDVKVMFRLVIEESFRDQLMAGKQLKNNFQALMYTVKEGYNFSRPQPGCHQPNSPYPVIIKLFPARESLVCDIPAGDGKNNNIFYSV